MPSCFNQNEWRDVTGRVGYIDVQPHRIMLKAVLPPGLYHCRLETEDGAFDMQTAMIDLVRVPDGKLVSTGPWDLDHMNEEMAMPMAKTYVNGRLTAGLWFDMPGPEEIACNRLIADFGFEAEEGESELMLELIERDRIRLDFRRVKYMTISHDERSILHLPPVSMERPRVYITADELGSYRARLSNDPKLAGTIQWLKDEALFGEVHEGTWWSKNGLAARSKKFQSESKTLSEQGHVARIFGWDIDLACLGYLITGDAELGESIKERILDLCSRPTWNKARDPLLMGGDNDRNIGLKLYSTGIAWDWCNGLFIGDERTVILDKVREYIQKMYDFTVLQRAYMGFQTADAHSTGTWNGVCVACMAFYDDLPIARKALPFFHGLFNDSLTVFPESGKLMWVTFHAYHLIRYLAAAHTFGGYRREWNDNPFLKNLGNALFNCFNALKVDGEEFRKGQRTIEYRYITAFLNRFHPQPGIDSIYRAFYEEEKDANGDVFYGIFDYLYAPPPETPAAEFPRIPYYAKDIGEIWFKLKGKQGIGGYFGAGLSEGRNASFRLMPHNRECEKYRGINVRMNGIPILFEIYNVYGIDSKIGNMMCIEDGGLFVNGQYLSGNLPSENSMYFRRVLISGRFIYAHSVLTASLHPKHRVRIAERIVVVDLDKGSIVYKDSFEGDKLVSYATHLHCLGAITRLSDDAYRLTGGQASLITGVKSLGDGERGEVFVKVLDGMAGKGVVEEEATWQPPYTWGLNSSKETLDVTKAKYPHLYRWRLEYQSKVAEGSFLVAVTTDPDAVKFRDERIFFGMRAYWVFGKPGPIVILGFLIEAEAVLVDEDNGNLMILGAVFVGKGKNAIKLGAPADFNVRYSDDGLDGVVYMGTNGLYSCEGGFRIDEMSYEPFNIESHHCWKGRVKSWKT